MNEFILFAVRIWRLRKQSQRDDLWSNTGAHLYAHNFSGIFLWTSPECRHRHGTGIVKLILRNKLKEFLDFVEH